MPGSLCSRLQGAAALPVPTPPQIARSFSEQPELPGGATGLQPGLLAAFSSSLVDSRCPVRAHPSLLSAFQQPHRQHARGELGSWSLRSNTMTSRPQQDCPPVRPQPDWPSMSRPPSLKTRGEAYQDACASRRPRTSRRAWGGVFQPPPAACSFPGKEAPAVR